MLFYRSIGDATARAIHAAVQELRKQYPFASSRWAPFIHVGLRKTEEGHTAPHGSPARYAEALSALLTRSRRFAAFLDERTQRFDAELLPEAQTLREVVLQLCTRGPQPGDVCGGAKRSVGL